MEYDCIVLTYDSPHRKTYDVLCYLKALGYNSVLVYGTPMRYKKTFHPIFEHRPPMNLTVGPQQICDNFHYSYKRIVDYSEGVFPSDIPVLICGAGIIPQNIVDSTILINSHPGYIPLVRGLDSYKWAIIEKKPIGVTTHIIGDEVDAGEIIERRMIDVYMNDTFHSVAYRVYENEISMLVEAIKHYRDRHFFENAGENVLHKRMKPDIELRLLEEFEIYKKEFCVNNVGMEQK